MISGPCPICHDTGGFHFEEVHAARPIAYGKALPVVSDAPACRSCGEPVNGVGKAGCRYPGHIADKVDAALLTLDALSRIAKGVGVPMDIIDPPYRKELP